MTYTYAVGDARKRALALCRGCYQRAVVYGDEALSGGTLRGRAAKYIGRYRASSESLLTRLSAEGIPYCVTRLGQRNVLVLGLDDPDRFRDLLRLSDATREALRETTAQAA